MSKNVHRLAEQFTPQHYELELALDKKAMTIAGRVTITGKKNGRPSQRLTFHQHDLKISSATITRYDSKGNQALVVDRINNHNRFDEVRLHTKQRLYPGNYSIVLEFSAKITKPMNGIYPCFFSFKDREEIILATQFESHHAREAFPCIDEPEAKATFHLTLTTDKDDVVLSNTPVEKVVGDRTAFETTPKMSTYLLAFVSGKLHGVTGKTKQGTLVSSWASVAQPKSHLNYANNEAIKALEFFVDYFDTPFPLPKLDQVALPDFDSLAMENWGLITFREVGILADPKNRTLSGEQLITMIVAHELSHQWFGNLVTMRWWDDLWLNESFASIMETLAPDRLHPNWQVWEDFLTGRVLSCSHRDIYKDVQAVGVKVDHPDEISTLFDPAIVYAKGARLLKMLYDYIGEEAFRTGLNSYFKKYAYGNTTRAELWGEFSAASHQDIEALMTPWLQQSGTPLLRVERLDKQLHLSQQRFLLDGEDKQTLWPIPLLADVKLEPAILKQRELDIDYAEPTLPLFNPDGDGHFIVSYADADVRDRLQAKIIDRSLGTISRVAILNDMLLLARHGDYHLTDTLELINHCQQEPREAVWSLFIRCLGFCHSLTDGDVDTERRIRAYQQQLASYWYKQLGWQDHEGDDPNAKHLRTAALSLSVGGENDHALQTALKMFKAAGSVEALPAEQRTLISGVVVRFGPTRAITQLMDEYRLSHNPDVQQAAAAALCSTRDPKVAARLIDWGLKDGGVVRQQDLDHWFAYLMRNHYSRDLAWQWLLSNWPRLFELFGAGKHMEYFVWYSSGPLSTPVWQSKFEAFFKPQLSDKALQRNIQIAFSEIAARVAWRKREEDLLKAYFQAFTPALNRIRNL